MFSNTIVQIDANLTVKTVLYWQCERRRDLQCKAVLKTDVNGNTITEPEIEHNHGISHNRVSALDVRRGVVKAIVLRLVLESDF